MYGVKARPRWKTTAISKYWTPFVETKDERETMDDQRCFLQRLSQRVELRT